MGLGNKTQETRNWAIKNKGALR